MRTHSPDLEKRIFSSCKAFGGSVHGTDGDGIMDVEFQNLIQAARFISFCKIQDRTVIRSDENGVSVVSFNRSVVVQVDVGAA